jgi:hypothetical protein
MANDSLPEIPAINKAHIIGIYLLTVLLPFAAVCIEAFGKRDKVSVSVIEKWFLFFAVGIRFLVRGIKQATESRLQTNEGLGNLSLGVVALISLLVPSWRNVTAFGSDLYFGAAALSCFLAKPGGPNETFTLISNTCIFLILMILLLAIT